MYININDIAMYVHYIIATRVIFFYQFIGLGTAQSQLDSMPRLSMPRTIL